MAPRNWSLCQRGREQASCGQQERFDEQEGCRIQYCQGESIDWMSFRSYSIFRNSLMASVFRSSRHLPRTLPMSNKPSWPWPSRSRTGINLSITAYLFTLSEWEAMQPPLKPRIAWNWPLANLFLLPETDAAKSIDILFSSWLYAVLRFQ